ncbi:phage head spike fiber domain-containing protein [Aeromonas dhakensis]|uniref:phage head spike fiber domain-containing protein n=1 Tax=Aeromonas dhakensis TaxID=196024 RepID=UPI003BA2CFAF
MAGLWKRDGTVAVTSGSKKVTGTGTTFADAKNGVAKGHLFCMTTGATVDLYEVDYVVSNTELFLVQAFRGVTGTGKAYEVITTFSDSIPEFARKLNASLSYYQGQSDMVQQLFTSDAAEITVTAPDGTTHKLIPWKRVTSDGEGQAARAKVEADRSKTEADRSGTEADRAAGIVAAAALPLPDVWAPLTDSLRLFTGYGREVKVGDDVIARMLTFTRSTTATFIGKDGQLKTAAVNEPRFEKEGLLIEGQSTNISNKWSGLGYWSGSTSDEVIEAAEADPFGVVGGVVSIVAKAPTNLYKTIAVQPATTYTFSIYYKVKGSPPSCAVKWGFEAAGIDGGAARVEINCLTGALMVSDPGVLRWKSTKLADGWNRFEVTAKTSLSATDVTLNISEATQNVGNSLMIFGWLTEALPFASSGIPTVGAAVTRAADVATLPQSLNLGESQLGFSLAVEFDSVNTGGYRVIELSNQSSIILDTASLTIRHAGREVYGINAPLGQRHHIAYSVAADGAITVALNGKLLTPQSSSASYSSSKSTIVLGNRVAATDRPLHGHLRDLKIWTKKPLTADQLKVASA